MKSYHWAGVGLTSMSIGLLAVAAERYEVALAAIGCTASVTVHLILIILNS